MKFELCGWGIRGGRYVGGAPGVPISWYIRFDWRYRKDGTWWWMSRNFYFGKEHVENTGYVAEWRAKVDALLREWNQ